MNRTRAQINQEIVDNEKQIEKLESINSALEIESMLLCDDEQWYTEDLEIRKVNKVNTEVLIGRIHWIEKIFDEGSGEVIIINRKEEVRYNGMWDY